MKAGEDYGKKDRQEFLQYSPRMRKQAKLENWAFSLLLLYLLIHVANALYNE